MSRTIKRQRIVYISLYTEIARAGLTVKELADATGINIHTMYRKLRGETEWKLWEAIKIKGVLGYKGPLEELFAKEEQ